MDDTELALPPRVLDLLYNEMEARDGEVYSQDAGVQRAWDDLGPILTTAVLRKGNRRAGPPVPVRVTTQQLGVIRSELESLRNRGNVFRGAAIEPVQLVLKRIMHFQEHGCWPTWKGEDGTSLHRPEIRAEAERVVREAIKECCRVARRKSSELGLPPGWKPGLKVSWNPKRTGSWGGRRHRETHGLYGGDGGVSLALHSYVPVDGQGGGEWEEYARIAKEPVIGNFLTKDWRNVVRALVAHEVAHTIQDYRVRHAPVQDRAKYKKPHGHGWQQVYALLRHNTVNPRLKAEAEVAATEVSLKWFVYRMTGTRTWETLGVVDARHQPAALKVAWEQFEITEAAEQRKVFVRREQDRLTEERA